MKGFFSLKDTTTDAKTPEGSPATCISCGKYKGVNSPKMSPFGKGAKQILLISSCPTELDDRKGAPWQGQEGLLLKKTLQKFGINLAQDTMTIHACSCCTDEITNQNIHCCRPKIQNVINKYKPKLILLLGKDALYSVIGKEWKKNLGGIDKWRGFQIPNRNLGAYVCPLQHPKAIINSESDLLQTIWENDIENALEKLILNRPIVVDDTKCITYITNPLIFKEAIQELKTAPWISFDYETTGLKPHKEHHQIVCTAASPSPNQSFVWMNTPKRNNIFNTEILQSNIGKVAHNINFEDTWSLEKLGAPVNNWIWCSMNTAHILDNRPYISGLKFQIFINFGVPDYDAHIASFLKATDTKKYGANGTNTVLDYIKKYGESSLLTYCGLDALYGGRLARAQMKKLEGLDVES